MIIFGIQLNQLHSFIPTLMVKRSNPLLLSFGMAIPLAVVIIVLLPPMFSKYNLELIDHNTTLKPHAFIHYFDLDGDSINERIVEFESQAIQNAAIIIEKKDSLIGQFNNRGEFPSRNNYSVTFADYDGNGLFELYYITRINDSAFLNVLHFDNEYDKVREDEYFLNTLDSIQKGIFDFGGDIPSAKDINHDGYKELFVRLNGNYSIFPRKLFLVDLKNRRVNRSPNFAAKITIKRIVYVYNKPYILVSSSVNANIDDPNPYIGSDLKEQIFLVDTSLSTVTKSVLYGKYHNVSKISMRRFSEGIIKAITIDDVPSDKQLYAHIRTFDTVLNRIDSQKIRLPFSYKDIITIQQLSNKFALATSNSWHVIDEDSQSINNITFDFYLSKPIITINIDSDKPEEIIAATQDSKLIVIDDDYHSYTACELPLAGDKRYYINAIPGEENTNKFIVQNRDQTFIYSYTQNPYYQLKYPFYAGIYFLLTGFVLLITKLARKNLQKKHEMEHEIRRLQIIGTRNQTSPHFNYNLLNSLSSAIITEDKEKAQRLITRMADLMRTAVESSETITRPLKDELEFVDNYLSLEEERYNGKFGYAIHIEQGLNTRRQIPKMLLQIFVENAVKHGIRHLERDNGMITIRVAKNHNKYLVTITDNGVGRTYARKKNPHSTSQGLKIMDKIITHYRILYKEEIIYRYTDIYDDQNKPAGTRVTIYLT